MEKGGNDEITVVTEPGKDEDGFMYVNSKRRRQQHKKPSAFIYGKKPQADPAALPSSDYDVPDGYDPSITVSVPKECLSILIGTGGRNVCLVVKHSRVFIKSNEEGFVQLYPRHGGNNESNLLLAQRMIKSIVAGGVIRWFTHPSSTNKYYHVSFRSELQDLVASMTKNACSLQLLRAFSGHLCLFVIPENDEFDEKDIAELRPALLAKIVELSKA